MGYHNTSAASLMLGQGRQRHVGVTGCHQQQAVTYCTTHGNNNRHNITGINNTSGYNRSMVIRHKVGRPSGHQYRNTSQQSRANNVKVPGINNNRPGQYGVSHHWLVIPLVGIIAVLSVIVIISCRSWQVIDNEGDKVSWHTLLLLLLLPA